MLKKILGLIISTKTTQANTTELSHKEIKFNKNVEILKKYGLEKSINTESSVDVDGSPIPWFSYPALEYLKQIDFSKKSIFEYGSGNSTLYWEKNANEVISIESDEAWYLEISKKVKKNTKIVYEPNLIYYPKTIKNYNKKFDVIVIDGKERFKCTINAIKYVKKNGMIILDDSERISKFNEYRKIVKLLNRKNYIQIDFCGFNPINDYTKATSIFISRNINFKFKNNNLHPYHVVGQIE